MKKTRYINSFEIMNYIFDKHHIYFVLYKICLRWSSF